MFSVIVSGNACVEKHESVESKICNIFKFVSNKSKDKGIKYLNQLGFYESKEWEGDYEGSINGFNIRVSYNTEGFVNFSVLKKYSVNNYKVKDDYELFKEFLFKKYQMKNVNASHEGNHTDTVGDRRAMCVTYYNPSRKIQFEFMNKKKSYNGNISYYLGSTYECTKYGRVYEKGDNPSSFYLCIGKNTKE